MSRYVRDDKQFREQIAKLADSGLRFPTDPNPVPSLPTGRGHFNLWGFFVGWLCGLALVALTGAAIFGLSHLIGGAH